MEWASKVKSVTNSTVWSIDIGTDLEVSSGRSVIVDKR